MRRLLIRPGAIGDCILAIPSLEHLAADWTEIWISRPVVPLIHFANSVRALASTGLDLVGIGDLPIPERLAEQLQTFDSIVSWYGANNDEFREALQAAGVECQFHRALPPSDFRGHATDFFLEQVGAPPGRLPRIEIPKYANRNDVVIHPFSGSSRKNWSLDRYRELADKLSFPVQWTAGPEEELARAVRFENLAELAIWLSGSRLYIGNDSGITHLAAACGLRTLALLGPVSGETWTPRGPNVTILRSATLAELTVQEVLAAANRLLGC